MFLHIHILLMVAFNHEICGFKYLYPVLVHTYFDFNNYTRNTMKNTNCVVVNQDYFMPDKVHSCMLPRQRNQHPPISGIPFFL